MPPSTVAGVVFVLAALSPGLIYQHVLTRFAARDSRSAVVEIVELATVGALVSVLASLAVLGAGQVVTGLVSLGELTGDPARLRTYPWSVLWSATLVLALSFGLAAVGGWLWVRRVLDRPSRIREGSAFSGVLAAKRDGLPAFLAVELDDGRLVEGVFRTVSVAEDPARDMLGLRRPILMSRPGTERTEVDEDFVLIPRTIVKAVHGRYGLRKRDPDSSDA